MPDEEGMARAQAAMQAMMAHYQAAGHSGHGDSMMQASMQANMQANMHQFLEAQQAMLQGYGDPTFEVLSSDDTPLPYILL